MFCQNAVKLGKIVYFYIMAIFWYMGYRRVLKIVSFHSWGNRSGLMVRNGAMETADPSDTIFVFHIL